MVNEVITSYDVVVVGAGPAGSSTARYAALAGTKTLLLDKKIFVGEPVRCGEFIPANEELENFFPPAKKGIEELFNLPSNLVAQRIKLIRLFSPEGKIYKFPLEGYTVERKWFDKYLVEQAAKAGAIVKLGEKVVGIREQQVVTEKATYLAKVIIGADGPSSVVARSVSLPANTEYAICAQYLMDDLLIQSEVMEMFSGKIAPGAYAWIIPKGPRSANVGVGIRKRFSGQVSVQRLLKYFVSDFPYTSGKLAKGKILSFVTGLVPTGGSFGETVKGNILIVGDAAGQVLPITGGGIPVAMLCGRIAGKVAADYLAGKSQLSDYDQLWRNELGKNFFAVWNKCKKIEWFLSSDFVLSLLLRIIGTKGIEKLIKLQ